MQLGNRGAREGLRAQNPCRLGGGAGNTSWPADEPALSGWATGQCFPIHPLVEVHGSCHSFDPHGLALNAGNPPDQDGMPAQQVLRTSNLNYVVKGFYCSGVRYLRTYLVYKVATSYVTMTAMAKIINATQYFIERTRTLPTATVASSVRLLSFCCSLQRALQP